MICFIDIHLPLLYTLKQIRDGDNFASVLLDELTGTTVPQYILSSTPAVFLIFTSDAANVFVGYSVTWEAIRGRLYSKHHFIFAILLCNLT